MEGLPRVRCVLFSPAKLVRKNATVPPWTTFVLFSPFIYPIITICIVFMKARPMEHKLQEDHGDIITCLDVCPKMRIFATGSMDFTVRIWNNHNKCIRYNVHLLWKMVGKKVLLIKLCGDHNLNTLLNIHFKVSANYPSINIIIKIHYLNFFFAIEWFI